MTAGLPSKSPAKGIFISFEGGDGAGKSTQIKRLASALQADGCDVVVTREPGGSKGAEAIRTLLVTGDKDRWSSLTEALLMYAARRDLLEKIILPALKRGAVVISDRFADSTLAYQGYAGGLGAEKVATLHNLVVGENEPDLTVILDAPVEEGLRRAGAASDETRFEKKGFEFQKRVREAFLDIAKTAPQRCVVIDARGSIAEVGARITAAMRKRLPGLISR